MRYLLFSVLLFICGPLFAQSPPEPAFPTWNVHLRGKYLIGGILEDLYWRGYNYGISFQWKRHTFGVDGTVFRQTNERDDNLDVAQYRDIKRSTSIYLDYSYRFLLRDYTEYYVQFYTRQHGNSWFWRERIAEDYSSLNPHFFEERSRGHFIDFGGGVGVRFHPKPRFGVDVNMNVAYRMWDREFRYFDQDVWNIDQKNAKSWIPMLRATLYFSLKPSYEK